MQVPEEDTELLKQWVSKKLKDISDADPDVLADYVVALVRVDEDSNLLREQSIEQLEEFLKDNTAKFVDDLLFTINNKAYRPDYKPPEQTPSSLARPNFNPPTGPASASQSFAQGTMAESSSRDQSRKRGYYDRDVPNSRDPHYGQGQGGDRGHKQMRRGGRGPHNMGARGGRPAEISMGNHLQIPQVPSMPTPPLGFPAFDPNNPMSAIMAMQAMGLPPLPGMPQLPQLGSPTGFQQQSGRSFDRAMPPRRFGQRCRDYDTKGFCPLGSQCPYDHGNEHPISSSPHEEYDPMNASIGFEQGDAGQGHGQFSPQRGVDRGGRARGSRGRGERNHHASSRGGTRASVSAMGPNFDRTNTSIVVEQIPEESFSEEAVRTFFSEFGSIDEVTMQAYKHLAVVKFHDYDSAWRAWQSPKSVFDNRFVKVYWYKQDKVPKPQVNETTGVGVHEGDDAMEGIEETSVDPAEFAKRQEEAQRAFEEKKAAMKEAAAKREELEKKMKAQDEERRKLYEKLAAKTQGKSGNAHSTSEGENNIMPLPGPTSNGSTSHTEAKSETQVLKDRLAELQAVAESMGIDPEETYQQSFAPRGRGFSAYRSHGRGRGFDSGRGAYNPSWGRGGFPPRGGAVKRLDNRPKRIAVSVSEQSWDDSKEEALRQYTIFKNTEVDSLDHNPDYPNACIVSFKERWAAEVFFNELKELPHVGAVDLNWVPNATAVQQSTSNPAPIVRKGEEVDTAMEEGAQVTQTNDNSSINAGSAPASAGMDYDVADDDDRWMT